MKGKIFMYLFVFSLLLVLFLFVNSKNIIESYDTKLVKAQTKIEAYKDSIAVLADQNLDLMYFNVDNNDDALSYFESFGYDSEKLVSTIKDALISTNNYSGDDHPIVPYVSMTDAKIMINKMRILNHKWIIADYTDGKHWGEVFLTYEVIGKDTINFKLVEYFMYPPNI